MKKIKNFLLVFGLFSLISCNINNPSDSASSNEKESSSPIVENSSDNSSSDVIQDPIVTGIFVSTMPDKVEYTEGELFDPTGMVVMASMDNGTSMQCQEYEYSKAPLTLQDVNFKISYQDFTTSIDLTINPAIVSLVDVEVRLIENAVYEPTDMFYKLVEVRELYSDNTSSSWYPLSDEDNISVSLKDGVATAKIELLINNVKFNKELSINYEANVVGVSELLTLPVSDITYYLNGYVISFATTMAATELLVMDKQTKDIIGVTNLLGPGLIYNYTLETFDFEIGDEVVIPVKLSQYEEKESYSNSTKLVASYVGDDDVNSTILSKGNEFTYDKSNATVISNQEDLNNFLSTENRKNNFYEFVKIDCATNIVFYSSSRHYRFFFDNEISSLADQKIDGVSPCFNDGTQYYTTNKTFSEMIFGHEDNGSTFEKPAKITKEIYALFIGGNGYYHEFVILNQNDITDLNIVLESTNFIAPDTLVYPIDSSFTLQGGKIVYDYTYDYVKEVDITMDMLDANTLPNMNQAGSYVVTGSYENYNFSFTVTVEDKKVSSIEIDTLPTTTTYNHRLTLDTLDVSGGKIKVNYNNNTSEIIDITKEMVSETSNFVIGEVSYPLTYKDAITYLTVNVVKDTVSVSEILNYTSGTYELEAIVLGPGSSHAAAELLVKDVENDAIIGIYNTGVVGKYNALDLDESVLNVGDRIITTITVKQLSNDLHTNGKIYANSSTATFSGNLIILSSNNEITFNFDNVTHTISTRAELEAFLSSDNRFYRIVKLVAPKAVTYSSSGYRIFFGSETSLTQQKIDGVSPFIYFQNTNPYMEDFTSYFTNPTSTSYSTPASSEYSFYAVLLGGNGYYYDFAVLGDSWVIK